MSPARNKRTSAFPSLLVANPEAISSETCAIEEAAYWGAKEDDALP